MYAESTGSSVPKLHVSVLFTSDVALYPLGKYVVMSISSKVIVLFTVQLQLFEVSHAT